MHSFGFRCLNSALGALVLWKMGWDPVAGDVFCAGVGDSVHRFMLGLTLL